MTTQRPMQIVILGGSGDLAKRKLIPALLDLFVHKKLPTQFSIIGLARTPRTDAEYRTFVAEAITAHGHGHSAKTISRFCSHVSYISGAFNQKESYRDIGRTIDAFEKQVGMPSNRLFYLAVPPEYYEVIFSSLAVAKLTKSSTEKKGWARILVEKPFGSDLKTAQKLDKKLSALFAEEQIFRIDHYLAKEAVQNILSFRFANTLLCSAWNSEHIQSVTIKMHETISVGTRGNFYDGIGALRDVGQNHLLQLLALVAMDEPKSFTPQDIRAERAKILKVLVPFNTESIKTQALRAQYSGYTETRGVAPDSQTETYFRLTSYLNTKKWKGVPFYIEAGQGMVNQEVSIEVAFKDVTTGPFLKQNCHTSGNAITLQISPKQTMGIRLNAKQPGHGYQLEPRTLSFACNSDIEEIDAYEKVLLDCIAGDQTLFTQTNEVLAAWKFITPILKLWNNIPLKTYTQGDTTSIRKLMSSHE